MGKFNKTINNNLPNSINMACGDSFLREDKHEALNLVLNSSLMGDSYYESEDDRINRIIDFINNNPELNSYMAKLSVFARNFMDLRSISHIILATLIKNVKDEEYLRDAIYKSILRPDDALEITSLYMQLNQNNKLKKMPNPLTRAIRDSFENKWDEYQLKKYASTKKELKLKDLVKLSKPNPNKLISNNKTDDENIFKKLIEDNLKQISTAETINSNSKDRFNAYKELITNNKLGYMALLKNLNNILNSLTEKYNKKDINYISFLDLLINAIESERAIINSKVLPFRFVQAYNMLSNNDKISNKTINKVKRAIENAFIISSQNINIVKENESVAILMDESGSMSYGSNNKSPFDISKSLLASMMCGLNLKNTSAYLWSNEARELKIKDTTKPLKFINSFHTRGGGTSLYQAFKILVDKKEFRDKIIILTDEQGWDDTHDQVEDIIKEYKLINPNVKIMLWNLEGYFGGTPFKMKDNMFEVQGYSDKMLELIPMIWEDKNHLVKLVNNIELKGVN